MPFRLITTDEEEKKGFRPIITDEKQEQKEPGFFGKALGFGKKLLDIGTKYSGQVPTTGMLIEGLVKPIAKEVATFAVRQPLSLIQGLRGKEEPITMRGPDFEPIKVELVSTLMREAIQAKPGAPLSRGASETLNMLLLGLSGGLGAKVPAFMKPTGRAFGVIGEGFESLYNVLKPAAKKVEKGVEKGMSLLGRPTKIPVTEELGVAEHIPIKIQKPVEEYLQQPLTEKFLKKETKAGRGLLDAEKPIYSDEHLEMTKAVKELGVVDTAKGYTENYNALSNQALEIDKGLKAWMTKNPTKLTIDDITALPFKNKNSLYSKLSKMEPPETLAKGSEMYNSYETLRNKLLDLSKDAFKAGTGDVGQLKVRQVFDTFYKKEFGPYVRGDKWKPMRQAWLDMRREFNTWISDMRPGDTVFADALKLEHQILTASDNILPKSVKEQTDAIVKLAEEIKLVETGGKEVGWVKKEAEEKAKKGFLIERAGGEEAIMRQKAQKELKQATITREEKYKELKATTRVWKKFFDKHPIINYLVKRGLFIGGGLWAWKKLFGSK